MKSLDPNKIKIEKIYIQKYPFLLHWIQEGIIPWLNNNK